MVSCKRAAIICGGSIEDYIYIKNYILRFNPDIIICADSGYSHAVNMQLDVDLIVGDFDSLENIPRNIKTVRYPAKKNYTDSEIALSHARKSGAASLLFTGATGSRADHTLTNIMMLNDCLSRGEDAEIVDEHNIIRLTDTSVKLTGEKNSLVSLVPLCDCFGVTTSGLAYPLCDDVLRVGEGRGISNVMSGTEACVKLSEGRLAVIITRD